MTINSGEEPLKNEELVAQETETTASENVASSIESSTETQELALETETEETVSEVETPESNTDEQAPEVLEETETPTEEVAEIVAETDIEAPAEPATEPTIEPIAETAPVVEAVVEGVAHVTSESIEVQVEEDEMEEFSELPDLTGADYHKLYTILTDIHRDEKSNKVDAATRSIKEVYEALKDEDENKAREAFAEAGNDIAEFKFNNTPMMGKIENLLNQYRIKRRAFLQDLEKSKSDNYELKKSVLEELRAFVDSDNAPANPAKLREIQGKWKNIGPIPSSAYKELFDSYSALLDRYHSNLNIYFELRDLDRKRNLTAKQELIERARLLLQETKLSKAVKELNEIQEEWRTTGPAPKDENEIIWKNFKEIADTIYTAYKAQVEEFKKDLDENFSKKWVLAEKAEIFSGFSSERITEWVNTAKEVAELQNEWNAIGPVPKDKATDLVKKFRNSVKLFFGNKQKFFNALESERQNNLKRKTELCEQAEAIKDSDDWNLAADELKALREQWRQVGPVPKKFQDSIYARFNAALDFFFDRLRNKNGAQNAEQADNLKAKEAICAEIEALAEAKDGDLAKLDALKNKFQELGFVPMKAKEKIQLRFKEAIDKFLDNSDIAEKDKNQYRPRDQARRMNTGGAGGYRDRGFVSTGGNDSRDEERQLKRKMQQVEDQINAYQNNISFFARSKNADALRADVEKKVAQLQKDLEQLKQQQKQLKSSAQ